MKKSGLRHIFLIFCSLAGIAGIFSIRMMDPRRTVSRDGMSMDTVVRMTASAAKTESELGGILDGAFGLLAEMEKKFSMRDPDSEISAINAASGAKWVKISRDTYAVLASSINASRLTDGAFDPTVGAVTLLWQNMLADGEIPDDGEISEAVMKTGFAKLSLSAPDGAFLDIPGGAIDLGGIAKGYASAALRDYLREKGVTSALIDLGGNVVVMGGRAERGETERTPWRVGIQHPAKPRGAPICVLEISEGAVVTAGVYERFREVGGRRYTHILVPKTGRPVDGELESATAVSNNPAQADALSTAFMVMGERDALRLLSILPGVDAVFVSRDARRASGYRITATAGLGSMLRTPDELPIEFADVR
ncbi:MAG: FAD:protein FMN transferase [Synergistaceae bacterium]|jgi:thiamine biosynthesis lipoprotein|nr:FAD:protein FMN transferase [Synergistaceae bacterium]